MPSNQLELALWLESDRMGFLMEGLNRTLLTNQRDVVRNERRQGEGRPYYVANEAVIHALFPAGHPYYGNVIGSHTDIESARVADVRDFHQQYYTPNNASIAIAGDFDPKALREMLTKYFGPIPRGPVPPPVNVTTPPITSQNRVTVTDTVKLPRSASPGSRRRHTRRDNTTPTPSSMRSAEPRRAGSARRSSTSRSLRRAPTAAATPQAHRHGAVHHHRATRREAGRHRSRLLEGTAAPAAGGPDRGRDRGLQSRARSPAQSPACSA